MKSLLSKNDVNVLYLSFAVIVLLRIMIPMILWNIVFTLMTFNIYFIVCWALNISLCLLLLRQFQTVFSTMKVIHGKFMTIKVESTLLSNVIPACWSPSFCTTWNRSTSDDWWWCWVTPTRNWPKAYASQHKENKPNVCFNSVISLNCSNYKGFENEEEVSRVLSGFSLLLRPRKFKPFF